MTMDFHGSMEIMQHICYTSCAEPSEANGRSVSGVFNRKGPDGSSRHTRV